MDVPTQNIVRGYTQPQRVVTRSEDGEDGSTQRKLVGQFARFNEWTEISSLFEGNFMERIAPGAFDDTLANDLARVKVLYDHGHDPSLGNKPLGTIKSVTPGDDGVDYEVDLIETDYNREFIVPAAEAGLLGASFRMRIRSDTWNHPKESSDWNPAMLPERTIEIVDLFEFGPVTFPAYEGASAAVRSRSDEFMASIATDARFLQRFMERTSTHAGARTLSEALALGLDRSTHGEQSEASAMHGSTHGEPAPVTRSQQAAMLEILTLTQRN